MDNGNGNRVIQTDEPGRRRKDVETPEYNLNRFPKRGIERKSRLNDLFKDRCGL